MTLIITTKTCNDYFIIKILTTQKNTIKHINRYLREYTCVNISSYKRTQINTI